MHQSVEDAAVHIIKGQDAEIQQMHEARERVRALHVGEVDITTRKLMCRVCDEEFPCDTLEALRLR